MRSSFFATTLITVLLSEQWLSCSAFTTRSLVRRTPVLTAHREGETTTCDRLTFLKTMTSVVVVSPMIAFADDGVDDLSMPTEDEQKAQEAAMQERLRKKAELQAQARKPVGYAESMEAERRKQKSLEKTKEERRQALCEELGRGC
ncbi:hypothetical protein HJC23_009944 [Cyclotella cryptica]|uniref:Uncharacterized protein n=1 Tax=Cyclotella cryptica TaxID=29204 RepID=A0ABD3Q801_9STRA